MKYTKNLILLGPPGCGKGTQAEKLLKILSSSHISTGEILRNSIKNETPTGLRAKSFVEKGELVPDEIVTALVAERLGQEDCKENGFILDGFPRNFNQTINLDAALSDLNYNIDGVLNFIVSKDAVIERLSGRRICKSCSTNFHIKFRKPKVDGVCDKCEGELYQRDDDNPETISKRMDIFNAENGQIIDFYTKKNVLINIDANNEPNIIFDNVIKALGLNPDDNN